MSTKKAKKNQAGLVSLPTVLVIGMLILAVGISVAAIAFSENLSTMKLTQSPLALFYAESGANDALERIVRNKNFTASSTYQIPFDDDGCSTDAKCAIIMVGAYTNTRVITSTGIYGTLKRSVRVDVTFDPLSDGEVQYINWREISY